MIYWGPNLNHIYYMHFCSKNSEFNKIRTPKMKKPFGNVRINSLTLVKMCLSPRTLSFHFPSHALTLGVNPRLWLWQNIWLCLRAIRKAMGLHSFLNKLGFNHDDTIIFLDNQGCLSLIKHLIHELRTCHINIQHMF
jgi:hypothetical protein